MKIENFEKAIEALACGIEIEEMKLRHAQVYQVVGHTANLKVIWDEIGRAFTMPKEQEKEESIELCSGQLVCGRRIIRDTDFDLKFE